MNITKKNKIVIVLFSVFSVLVIFVYTALFNVDKNDCDCALDPNQSDIVFSGSDKNERSYLIKPTNLFLEDSSKNKWYMFLWYPEELTAKSDNLKKNMIIELKYKDVVFGNFTVENSRVGDFGHQILSTDRKENIVKLCQYYAPLYFEDKNIKVVEDCANYCKKNGDNFCISQANESDVNKILKNNFTIRNVENK